MLSINNSCVGNVYNHKPFEEGTKAGKITAIIKQVLIGLILTGGLTVGTYYASMYINSLMFASPAIQLISTVLDVAGMGGMGLGLTGALAYAYYKDTKPQEASAQEASAF